MREQVVSDTRAVSKASPKLPVQYEQACTALAECTTIDEAKYWDNKADALAAWAKIYKSDQAAVEAKRLKLHAYRRMGQLSAEIQPGGFNSKGIAPGPAALLKENGLRPGQVGLARRIARAPVEVFEQAVARKNPPTPCAFKNSLIPGTQAWRDFGWANGPIQFRSFTRRFSARDMASSMDRSEKAKASNICKEIMEWLDEFDRHLRIDGDKQ